jgi:DNA-directed RNA polymerase subunit RPC12/RpoP
MLRAPFGSQDMGSQIVAKCECGVEVSILIGGGMMNFHTTCFFPCLCESCHSIVQVNLLAKAIRCPECRAPNPIPYDDPRLQGAPGKHNVAEWNMKSQLGRKLVLTDGRYRCSKCGKMSLQFSEDDLCWD